MASTNGHAATFGQVTAVRGGVVDAKALHKASLAALHDIFAVVVPDSAYVGT